MNLLEILERHSMLRHGCFFKFLNVWKQLFHRTTTTGASLLSLILSSVNWLSYNWDLKVDGWLWKLYFLSKQLFFISFMTSFVIFIHFIYKRLLMWLAHSIQGQSYKEVNVMCNAAGIYLLKVNNRKTRISCEICSNLTIKTPERQWRCSDVFIINLEYILHLVLVFLLLTLNDHSTTLRKCSTQSIH